MSRLVRILVAVFVIAGMTRAEAQTVAQHETIRSVRKMLERLPYCGVFDFIAFGVERPIHIIVKRGRTTLLGVVDNASDRQVAEVRGREVMGVFGVENDLMVRR